MKPELSIKLDYLENRENPAEVFEAMAQYIHAYQGMGQLLCNAVGEKADFSLTLDDVEQGSIITKLNQATGSIADVVSRAIFGSSNNMLSTLSDENPTETEEDVEEIALDLENSISERLPDQLADPSIDRQLLAQVLEKLSKANEKTQDGETVVFKSSTSSKNDAPIDTSWRFTGNVKEMFQGTFEHMEITDYLEVEVSVNRGNGVWKFKSSSFSKIFTGRITERQWLKDYQSGLIPAIGPLDVIKAKVSLDLFTPVKGKRSPEIRNAKIIKVISIERNNGKQTQLSF